MKDFHKTLETNSLTSLHLNMDPDSRLRLFFYCTLLTFEKSSKFYGFQNQNQNLRLLRIHPLSKPSFFRYNLSFSTCWNCTDDFREIIQANVTINAEVQSLRSSCTLVTSHFNSRTNVSEHWTEVTNWDFNLRTDNRIKWRQKRPKTKIHFKCCLKKD